MRDLIIARINDLYNSARLLGFEAPPRSKITLVDKTDEQLLDLYTNLVEVHAQKVGVDQANFTNQRKENGTP